VKIQHSILDSLSTSIFLLTPGLEIAYLNESAEFLIQISKNRAVGKLIGNVIKEYPSQVATDFSEIYEDGGYLLQGCRKCLKEGLQMRLHDLDLILPTSRESRSVECSIHPVEFEGEMLICIELFERTQMERATRDLNAGVQRQQLVRGLAHEIRNPLGGIRGAAQLLASELDSQSLTEYTDVIIGEVDRLSRLVSQMQATTTTLNPQRLNIHFILEHVRLLIESEISTEISLVPDYDPSLPDLYVDQDQLTQAILNMARNALEAVGENFDKPKIIFRTRIDHQILNSRHQRVLRIDIEDNGCGVSDDIVDYIFEPMVSGSPTGTGLGLSITSEIISAHGGVVFVNSEPGNTILNTILPFSLPN
jgi:two-component system nitrogen regulation sensor histidine kinase GlnL